MNLKFISLLLVATLFPMSMNGSVKVVNVLESDITLGAGEDLHIRTAGKALADGVKIIMADADSRLYFDSIRPTDVMVRYGDRIFINGSPIQLDANALMHPYVVGAEVLPHTDTYSPLEAFDEFSLSGNSEKFMVGMFYSNEPNKLVVTKNRKPFLLEDNIQSFRLRRGYMATLAENPDGTGYSRCFIAEDEDLVLNSMPIELSGKVSFVRVLPWKKVSKRGWSGGNNDENPPEGFLNEQCDALNCTWFYNWGSDPDYGRHPDFKGTPWRNQEFVMEKWGAGSDRSWQKIYNNLDATHLISYNEPDHKEQSNVGVDTAIEEWPRHLSSGLRLGSPATTDFWWLYQFMDECEKRHYRVDYVVIHAYWGGPGGAQICNSVSDWKRIIRNVHNRVKRPIWVKEWNNGASWTNEEWPEDKAAQQEKQRKFIAEILKEFNDIDYIERYSIFNWVEEKRAMLWGSLDLTPAGEAYRDAPAGPAFSRSAEYIPTNELSGIDAIDDDETYIPVLVYDAKAQRIARSDFAPLGNIRVVNLSGATVVVKSGIDTLSTADLPAGIYIAYVAGIRCPIKFIIK